MVLNDNMIALSASNEECKDTQRQDAPDFIKVMKINCKKLNVFFPRCKSVQQVFAHPMIVSASNELKAAVKLSFMNDSTESSNLKTLELVWGRCFYEPIVLAKKLSGPTPSQNLSDSERGLFVKHIYSGKKYFGELAEDFTKMKEGRDSQTLDRLIHRTLVCIGDLSRYEIDYADEDQKAATMETSKSFYKKAVLVQIRNGFPYNQLAVLLKDSNYGLDSIIFYLKGATVTERFEKADENLKQALKKIHKTETSCTNGFTQPSTEKLIGLWLQIALAGVLETSSLSQLKKACQDSMSFLLGLLRQTTLDTSSPINNILSKMVVLPLILIERMDHKGDQENHISLLTAFELGLFNTFVKKFLKDLTVFVYGHEVNIIVHEDIEEDPEGKPRPKFNDKRRRRKNNHSQSQSESDSDFDSNASAKNYESEGDETQDRHDFDNDSDGGSGILYSDSDEDISDDEFSDALSVDDRKDAMEIATFIGKHGFSEVLGVCGYWLMNTPGLIGESDSGSAILRHSLEQVFEVLRLENFKNGKKIIKILDGFKDSFMEQPFPEDFETCGLKVFEVRHAALDWDILEDLLPEKLGVFRLNQIFALRDWLKTVPKPKPATEVAEEKEEKTDKRKMLMQNMAQLWLQQESMGIQRPNDLKIVFKVNNLEDVNQSLSYPLYLMVDHWTLICHLSVVKRIVGTKKIVVIIPHAVIQELDYWKRDEPGCRNAIFWLEREFKQGNRWLKPEKLDENLTLAPEVYGPKPTKPEKNIYRILECAHFYAKKHNNMKSNQTESLILLTVGKEECETKVKAFRAIPESKDLSQFKDVALEHGIKIHEASTFFDQFKISFPNIFNGKAPSDGRVSDRKIRRRRQRPGP